MAQGSNRKIVLAVGLGAVALVVALVMYTSGSDSSPTVTPESRRVVEGASDLDETTPVAERRRPAGGEDVGSTRLAADSSDQSDMDAGEDEAQQVRKRKSKNTKRKKSRRDRTGDQQDEEEAPKASKRPSRRPIKLP